MSVSLGTEGGDRAGGGSFSNDCNYTTIVPNGTTWKTTLLSASYSPIGRTQGELALMMRAKHYGHDQECSLKLNEAIS